MRSVAIALAVVTLLACTTSASAKKSGGGDVDYNYVWVPADDPHPAERAAMIAAQRAGCPLLNLTSSVWNGAPVSTYPANQVARNVTLVGGSVCGQLFNAHVGNTLASSTVRGLMTAPGVVAARAALAGFVPQTVGDYARIYDYGLAKPDGLRGALTAEHQGRLRTTNFIQFLWNTPESEVLALQAAAPRFLAASEVATLRSLARRGRLFHQPFGQMLRDSGVNLDVDAALPGNFVMLKPETAFYVDGDDDLQPVGIHIGGDWVTPTTGTAAAWQLAQMSVNAMDVLFQTQWHFADPHLSILPFANGALRWMSPNHPVYKLIMTPSKDGVGLSGVGFQKLFEPTGSYSAFSPGKGLAMHGFINYDLGRIGFDDRAPVRHLKLRGLDKLSVCDYCEDVEMYDHAISRFVRAVLRKYYRNDVAVRNDAEVQAVWAEAADPKMGALWGLSPADSIDSLAKTITHMMLNAVVHHATNSRSYSEYQQVATYAPITINATWPGAEHVTTAFVMAALPPIPLAITVANSVQIYNRTCDAAESFRALPYNIAVGTGLDDARARFADDLDAIQVNIEAREARNPNRVLPWTLLKPSDICSAHLV